MDELVKVMLNDIDRIKAENEKLKAENQKQKEILNRLSQTKVNHQIKNPFAFTSGLCCHHCDHKDEYIIELEEENEELKKMLKQAVEDLDFIGEYFGCAGCSAAKSWRKCPFNDGKKDCCTDKWRYADKALKLIGDDEND